MYKPISQYNLQELALRPKQNQLTFSARHAILSLSISASAYTAIAILAILLSSIGINETICLVLIHAAGAIAMMLLWKNGRWGNARHYSFGAAFLLLAIAYRIHALVDAIIYGTRIDTIYSRPNIPTPDSSLYLLLKGEVITVSAFLIIACVWRFNIGKDVERHSYVNNIGSAPLKISIIVYACALAIYLLRTVAGASFGALDQIATLFFTSGIAAIHFIAARMHRARTKVIRAIWLGLPLSLLALSSGMKTEMFFPLIPAAIIFWANFPQKILRLFAICGGGILLAISQLYVHHVRELTWFETGDKNISTITLISDFVDNFESVDVTDALDQISSRVNLTIAHATTITLADHYGHEPISVFGSIPASLVPRILWPDKPVLQPGAMHTARILGTSGPLSEITSATAAGFGPELYLGGSWVGVIVGSIIYGWLAASAQKWSYRFSPGFGHQVICFTALYGAIRFDEKHIIYAYTSIIFTAVFIWMLIKMISAIGIPHSNRPSHVGAT